MGEKINKENAAELGRRGGKASGESKRRKAEMSPEDRAKDAISQKVGALTDELLNIALGKGDFSGEVEEKEEDGVRIRIERQAVAPDLRFRAITIALAYGLGKPTGISRVEAPKLDESELESSGLQLTTGTDE